MRKQIVILNGAMGLIAASCLAARADAPVQMPKGVIGAWVLETQQSRPDGDRLVFRDDRTLVVTQKGERLPGSWKPLEGNRLQLALSTERRPTWQFQWKMLDGGILRLWDAKHRNEAPTFWVRPPAAGRRAKQASGPRPIWDLSRDKDGDPICARCDRAEFGQPKTWRKHSADGRTVACRVCHTAYLFMLPNGTVYQPEQMARKGKYSAFRKLVSREGTWKLQSGSNANMISFNASTRTAFVAGQKWLWEEVAKDRLQVTYPGDKHPRDWKWELSDDRSVVLVTESIPTGNAAKQRTFSLISMR